MQTSLNENMLLNTIARKKTQRLMIRATVCGLSQFKTNKTQQKKKINKGILK